MGMKFTTYHKTGHLCGIMNSYAFWSDFSEKQNGNLVWLKREKKIQIWEKKFMWIQIYKRAHTIWIVLWSIF